MPRPPRSETGTGRTGGERVVPGVGKRQGPVGPGPGVQVQYGGSGRVSRRVDISEELMTKVQDLIDNMINPAVAGHGGYVELIDVRESTVYLQMGGGCQGCGAADITLKAGIERLIKEETQQARAA